MQFDLSLSISVLERTPAVLTSLLDRQPEAWTHCSEGGDSWSPFDVIGHLVHGERTDWLQRINLILEHGEDQPFEPFDRFAQFEDSKGKTIDQLLGIFAELRAVNITALRELDLSEEQLQLRGTHPALGPVTMSNLLAAWTAHDLGHIYQISRTMAGQYKQEVGPWTSYMRVLQESAL